MGSRGGFRHLDGSRYGNNIEKRRKKMGAPDITNLANCVEDARQAALDKDRGPKDPLDYYELVKRLELACPKLPPLYREAACKPFIVRLEELGRDGFEQILRRDPTKEGEAGLLLDIAQAILQQAEGYLELPTDAFQEVVADLYDGFLSLEDRTGVNPPDKGIIAPLVKWGRPDYGPYTWPVSATLIVGVKAAVVNLPPAFARRGISGWSSLAHETGGHDILHADTGLADQLTDLVYSRLVESGLGDGLPRYWAVLFVWLESFRCLRIPKQASATSVQTIVLD